MFKVHRAVKATTLLVALGLITFVWAHGRSMPSATVGATDTVRAVKLRLTFEAGDSANVTQLEGGVISIEKNGKKLAITPYIREQGQVELQVFQMTQREGREAMEAVDTLRVDKSLTKLTRGSLPFSVKVVDINMTLPAQLAAAPPTCCARTCNGTLICGTCVCTDCGACAAVRWCDCAPPAPAGPNSD